VSSKNRNAAPNSEWTKFKMECANEIGHSQFVKEKNDHYKGDVPAKINGAQGGPIGGRMVQKMIAEAKSRIPQS